MNQAIFQKYNQTYGIRYTKRQKRRALDAIDADFHVLGYDSTHIKGRFLFTKADNLVCGNLKHAKTIIVVAYDTPQWSLWRYHRFYPFHGNANRYQSVIPMMLCTTLFYAFAILSAQMAGDLIQNEIGALLYLWGILVVTLFFCYFFMHGIANRHNANRYTAGIVAAYEIAAGLSKDQRRKVAFVFLQEGRIDHYGTKVLADELRKQNKNPDVILLSAFARGSVLRMGYKPAAKKAAQGLALACESKQMELIGYDQAQFRMTIVEQLEKVMVIAAGDLDHKQRLCVSDTASGKDRQINSEYVDTIVDTILRYLRTIHG